MRHTIQFRETFSTPDIKNRLQERVGVKTDVILGSPSARCNGVGICRVMGHQQSTDCPCPVNEALISVNSKGDLRIRFDQTAMTPTYKARHFKWHLFTVVEPYRLSPRLCKEIGWSAQWIQPGVYRVWECEGELVVDFSGTKNHIA